jgi:hypothetical protein
MHRRARWRLDAPQFSGSLEGNLAASLAGLAPISRQSRKWQGKERIQGGRAFLRRSIYMPSLVATRYNPDLKAKYDQLTCAGNLQKSLEAGQTCGFEWALFALFSWSARRIERQIWSFSPLSNSLVRSEMVRRARSGVMATKIGAPIEVANRTATCFPSMLLPATALVA